jgi:hypothetical protein
MTSSRIRWAEYVAQMDTIRNEYRILVRRFEGSRQFAIPRLKFLLYPLKLLNEAY